MENEAKKPKLLKSDTRQWPSGRVKFAVIGWEGKPERNYIIFEKNFFGNSIYPDQKFNLRFTDWQNLKKLIDGELSEITEWTKTISVVDQRSLSLLIENNPEAFETILSNPNILKLGDKSLEFLDRIAIKLYEVKTNKIDLILEKISEATSDDLDRFSSLLNDLKLNQISMMASLIYQKLKVIDILEKVVTRQESRERDVHKIIEKNPWIIGRAYEIIQSDRPLNDYFNQNLKVGSENNKRPDLIIKIVPYKNEVIIVELKAPGIKLKARHIGQVLEYKALVEKNKPNISSIKCFVYGYEKDYTFVKSNDVEIKTFSELITELRTEYNEYQKVLEIGKEYEQEDIVFN